MKITTGEKIIGLLFVMMVVGIITFAVSIGITLIKYFDQVEHHHAKCADQLRSGSQVTLKFTDDSPTGIVGDPIGSYSPEDQCTYIVKWHTSEGVDLESVQRDHLKVKKRSKGEGK